MAKQRKGSKPVAPGLGLDDFKQPQEEQGLSLDQLSEAYAQLLEKGIDPYREPAPPADLPEGLLPETEEVEPAGSTGDNNVADDGCPISPRSILEAMLFVGHPQNEPLTSQRVASLMRGVRPEEIDELVVELNEIYATERRPYEVVSTGAGYRLALRDEFAPLREKFHARVREARLNQAAVDVLAIVAYNQPLSRPEIDKFRGQPSGVVINQLVRRELLRVDRPAENPRAARYHTTERFLDLFGLDSLADLPRSQELDRA
jgi:segregation and condensation protein B